MATEQISAVDKMRLGSLEFKMMDNRLRRHIQKNSDFRLFLAMLESRHVDLTGKRILDAGCGAGYGSFLLAAQFHPKQLVGIDLMPEQIDLARVRYPDLDFRVGNLLDIGEQGESFDAAFVFGVIHHIPQWQMALQELTRCLFPGGHLLIEEPRKRFSFPELEAGIKVAGFEILERKRLRWGIMRAYLAKKPGSA
jgi:ubiquinone/menaquinone biosynthesis C-methylase UbiE